MSAEEIVELIDGIQHTIVQDTEGSTTDLTIDGIDHEVKVISGPGPSGGIASVVAGAGIAVDDTDPVNPVVSSPEALPYQYAGNPTPPDGAMFVARMDAQIIALIEVSADSPYNVAEGVNDTFEYNQLGIGPETLTMAPGDITTEWPAVSGDTFGLSFTTIPGTDDGTVLLVIRGGNQGDSIGPGGNNTDLFPNGTAPTLSANPRVADDNGNFREFKGIVIGQGGSLSTTDDTPTPCNWAPPLLATNYSTVRIRINAIDADTHEAIYGADLAASVNTLTDNSIVDGQRVDVNANAAGVITTPPVLTSDGTNLILTVTGIAATHLLWDVQATNPWALDAE